MEQKQKTKPARQQKRDRSHLVFMMIAGSRAAVYRTQLFRYFFGSSGNDTGYARHGE